MSLKLRLRNLEKALLPKEERAFCLSVGMWGGVYYLLVPESKLREGEKNQFHGPFPSNLAACQWLLNDLKQRHPEAYSTFEKIGLDSVIEGILKQKQLMVQLETSPWNPAPLLEVERDDHVNQS